MVDKVLALVKVKIIEIGMIHLHLKRFLCFCITSLYFCNFHFHLIKLIYKRNNVGWKKERWCSLCFWISTLAKLLRVRFGVDLHFLLQWFLSHVFSLNDILGALLLQLK